MIDNNLFLANEIWFYILLIPNIKILLLLYISRVFPHITKKIKICGGPRDSVKIRVALGQQKSAQTCNRLFDVRNFHDKEVLITVFWVVTMRNLVEDLVRFTGTCCLHLQSTNKVKYPEDGYVMSLRNTDDHLQVYPMSQPREPVSR
jgi:hypothetical protein